MAIFDYSTEAELSPTASGVALIEAGRRRMRQPTGYGRFARAADAIRFAIEELPPELLLAAPPQHRQLSETLSCQIAKLAHLSFLFGSRFAKVRMQPQIGTGRVPIGRQSGRDNLLWLVLTNLASAVLTRTSRSLRRSSRDDRDRRRRCPQGAPRAAAVTFDNIARVANP
jgi:hypothetical protein